MDVRSGVFDDFVVFGLCARTRDRVKIYCESSAFPASNTQKITAQRPTSSSGRSCTCTGNSIISYYYDVFVYLFY